MHKVQTAQLHVVEVLEVRSTQLPNFVTKFHVVPQWPLNETQFSNFSKIHGSEMCENGEVEPKNEKFLDAGDRGDEFNSNPTFSKFQQFRGVVVQGR